MTLYAQAGEPVVCENGHPICIVARNILVGQRYRPGDFDNWLQSEPAPGTYVEHVRCAECGSAWWGALGDGTQGFHFKEGWRW